MQDATKPDFTLIFAPRKERAVLIAHADEKALFSVQAEALHVLIKLAFCCLA